MVKARDKRVTMALLKLEANLKKEWAVVLLQEEMFWMQKNTCVLDQVW